jgi:hypothetical protein
MVPMFSLASMRREERARANQPLLLTMLPGGAAQKTAVAAVAVTQQVRDGLRQERRVAEQTVDAVAEAAASPAAFDRDRLAQKPALRTLASDELVTRIKAIPDVAALPVVEQAADALVTAIGLGQNTLLPKADAAKYPDLVNRLTDAQKAAIFKP